MMKTLLTLLLAGLLLGSGNALAEAETAYNRASLAVTVSEEIRADTISAQLGISVQGKNSAELVATVNRRIREALDLLKRYESVHAETLNYNTRPLYQNGRHSGLYEVSQSIRVESMAFDTFARAIDKLQELLDLQSVRYSLSRTARGASEDRLTRAAIQRFRERARAISKDFGFKDYRLVSVNIGGSPQYHFQSAERLVMADSAAAPPPTFQAGDIVVTVSVNGSIEMLD